MKFDEIAIEKLPMVLTENTMPARYYPLVPGSRDTCNGVKEVFTQIAWAKVLPFTFDL